MDQASLATQVRDEISIDVTELHTPITSCVSVALGAVRKDLLEQLEAAGYDQAPVFGDDGDVLGLVETRQLRALFIEDRSLTADGPISQPTIAGKTTVDALLTALTASRAALVAARGSPSPIGLVTISDLNRHAFRKVIYSVVAELEDRLARLIERRFSDPWQWLARLSEDHQIRLLGYVEVTRRRDVDVSPVAACTLTQLLRVVGAFSDLRQVFGCQSGTRWESLAGPVIDLRNRVMHPARPMVLGQEDVARLKGASRALVELHNRARAVGPADLRPTR